MEKNIDEKITDEVDELISICVKAGIKNDTDIQDMASKLRIRLYAIHHRFGYSISEDGNIIHNTEQGKKLIKRLKMNLV